jgi:HEAT repeat protein
MPTPEPTPEPSKPKYPDEVNGRKLDWYLKQTSYVVQRDPQLRDAAIRTLPVFGPSACGPSINPLVAVIEGDPDPGVRIAAIAMVSSMGFEHRNELKKAVATLKRVIAQTGRGSALRVYCVRSLGSFGPDAAVAVPELRSLATVEAEPSWETRMAVAEALGYVGMPPKAGVSPNSEAVKTLIERMLEDPCLSVRLEAVKSLLSVGPPQTKNPEEYKKEVAPYLTLLQKHLLAESGKDPVRGRYADKGVYVWLLLLQIMYDDRTAPENLKLITKLVKEPEGNKDATGTPASVVRLYAIQAIGAMGPQFAAMRINPALAPTADAAIQSVIDAMNYTELPLQVAAMMCLAKIGNEARKAVPELEKIKARPLPPKPANAPPDWRADDTLQRTAGEAIDYIMGKKKLGEPAKKEEKKDAK